MTALLEYAHVVKGGCITETKNKIMIAKITLCVSLFIQSPIELDRATTYNAEINQCDSDPLTTADGSRIDLNKL
ncbi:hypothetical protein, partial [Winogradskyella sp.]|uniref:hypothetical protein n=1 Tax=Winogradskyella sp. TaxID=1883156 RepID=UPI003F6A21B4